MRRGWGREVRQQASGGGQRRAGDREAPCDAEAEQGAIHGRPRSGTESESHLQSSLAEQRAEIRPAVAGYSGPAQQVVDRLENRARRSRLGCNATRVLLST